MTNKEMQQHINAVAKSVRKDFKYIMPKEEKLIDINWGLPYVSINLPTGEEYFFQDEAASEILEQATNTGNKFSVSIENALIWMAQSW